MDNQNPVENKVQNASNGAPVPASLEHMPSANTAASPEDVLEAHGVQDPNAAASSVPAASASVAQSEVPAVQQASSQTTLVNQEDALMSAAQDLHPTAEAQSASGVESSVLGAQLVTPAQGEASAAPQAASVSTPLTQVSAPAKKSSVGKIVLIVVAILALLIILGGWGLNKAVGSAFEEQFKEQFAKGAHISPDQVQLEVEGRPQLLQVIAGKYEHIVVHADIPAVNIMSTSLGKKDASSVVPVTMILQDVDVNTKIAKHIEISYSLDSATVDQYLKSSFGDPLFLGMSSTEVSLIEGGFHLEGEISELGMPATLKMDNTIKLDQDGNIVINTEKATLEALGESLDITEDVRDEPTRVNPADITPLLKDIRLTQFDLTLDGLQVKCEGDNVNLDRIMKR